MKKIITNVIFQLIIAGAIVQVSAQTSNYSDVLIVINEESTISDSIGTYFAQQRKIPAANIVYITAPTTEEIDSVQFEQLRSQIETYLISTKLQDKINFIVTTKGVPLKVNRGNIGSGNSSSSSVESELTLILGPMLHILESQVHSIIQCKRTH